MVSKVKTGSLAIDLDRLDIDQAEMLRIWFMALAMAKPPATSKPSRLVATAEMQLSLLN